jgi:hypothetical protein
MSVRTGSGAATWTATGAGTAAAGVTFTDCGLFVEAQAAANGNKATISRRCQHCERN